MFFRNRAARRRNREIVEATYKALTMRARRPVLFIDGGVEDTVMGRFESVCLELFLFLRRCREDSALSAFTQDLVDHFITDVEHSIRELGVGDPSVPKRMRKLAGYFYERVAVYDKAMDDADPQSALSVALVGRAVADPGKATALAELAIAEQALLRAVSTQTILSGQLEGAFPA